MLKISPDAHITTNSQDVKPGSIFVAVKGQRHDGHDFIPDAVSRGAKHLVLENRKNIPANFKGLTEEVMSSRRRLAEMACEKYWYPSRGMFCVGITGTNGKTSISFLIEHLLTAKNIPTGVIGTVDHHLGSRVWPTELTTPDSLQLQARLAEFIKGGAQALSMEVSSHALEQRRADGIEFDAVIFNNLTRDHLDYHKTYEAYFEAKARLFTEVLMKSPKKEKRAVINVDDEWGKKLLLKMKTYQTIERFQIWTFGKDDPPLDSQAAELADKHLKITLQKSDFAQTRFSISDGEDTVDFAIPLIGLHNVMNTVAALGAVLETKVSLEDAAEGLKSFNGVPGRLERVPNNKGLHIFVDYAHTPDGLENVLKAFAQIQQQTAGADIWTVFGCGGDRDKGKRPMMAEIAEKYSQGIIVTSDNPRTEDPHQIISEIKTGFKNPDKYIYEADRRKALALSVQKAKKGDAILIAGKGHEDYQIIGTQKIPFSDQKFIKEILDKDSK
ncbi:MAG: UDP-N-acetylmuramoyl-L-alanyl-D-glutamate--2,6-diaminopimelate ligase [Bdellovibrionota bacterium]